MGETLFVTFRLFGSLPANREFPTKNLSSGKAFVAIDSLLDGATSGPQYLRMPEIADIVLSSLNDGQSRFHRYDLHSYVIMPNHVHMLLTPHVITTKWLGPLKGFTAHQANRILRRKGPFWQDESYDRLVRSDVEFDRIMSYIENNPVKAGLAPNPEAYRWSSAAANLT